MKDLILKSYVDQLINLTPDFRNKLEGMTKLDDVLELLDEILINSTEDNDGFMSKEDKANLEMLLAHPQLKLIDKDGNIFDDITQIEIPKSLELTGFRKVKIIEEKSTFEYNADFFGTEHHIVHNLGTMFLNVNVIVKSLGSDVYSTAYANIDYLNENEIIVTFTRAEMPKVFLSKR